MHYFTPGTVNLIDKLHGRAYGARHGRSAEPGKGGSLGLSGANRAGSNRDAAAAKALDRTAKGVREVVVRISGRQKSGAHTHANMAYNMRLLHKDQDDLALEGDDGKIYRSADDIRALAMKWEALNNQELDGQHTRRKGDVSRSMVLSHGAGIDPEKLYRAARDFAGAELGNHRYVTTMHLDTDNPHVHLTYAIRDKNGVRGYPDRETLQRWRETFAEKLREQGIEANATPRKARMPERVTSSLAMRKMLEKGSAMPQQQRPASAAQQRDMKIALETYGRAIADLGNSARADASAIGHSLGKFLEAMNERARGWGMEVEPPHTAPEHGQGQQRGQERASPADNPAPPAAPDKGVKADLAAIHAMIEKRRAEREAARLETTGRSDKPKVPAAPDAAAAPDKGVKADLAAIHAMIEKRRAEREAARPETTGRSDKPKVPAAPAAPDKGVKADLAAIHAMIEKRRAEREAARPETTGRSDKPKVPDAPAAAAAPDKGVKADLAAIHAMIEKRRAEREAARAEITRRSDKPKAPAAPAAQKQAKDQTPSVDDVWREIMKHERDRQRDKGRER